MGIHPSLRRRLLLCREHHQPRTPSRTTHDRAGSGLHPTTTPRPAGVVPRVRTHRRSLGAGETGPELVTSKTSRPHRGALPRPPRPRPPTKCHPEQGHQRADIVKVTASVPEVSTIGRRTTSARPTATRKPDHQPPLSPAGRAGPRAPLYSPLVEPDRELASSPSRDPQRLPANNHQVSTIGRRTTSARPTVTRTEPPAPSLPRWSSRTASTPLFSAGRAGPRACEQSKSRPPDNNSQQTTTRSRQSVAKRPQLDQRRQGSRTTSSLFLSAGRAGPRACEQSESRPPDNKSQQTLTRSRQSVAERPQLDQRRQEPNQPPFPAGRAGPRACEQSESRPTVTRSRAAGRAVREDPSVSPLTRFARTGSRRIAFRRPLGCAATRA